MLTGLLAIATNVEEIIPSSSRQVELGFSQVGPTLATIRGKSTGDNLAIRIPIHEDIFDRYLVSTQCPSHYAAKVIVNQISEDQILSTPILTQQGIQTDKNQWAKQKLSEQAIPSIPARMQMHRDNI